MASYSHGDQASNTLPGYLIHLNAEFSVGDNIIETAPSSITMGSELLEEMGYWQPNRGWNTSRNQPVAGEYRAIALDLQDRKSTRLNSSHVRISYAVFCLKKKNIITIINTIIRSLVFFKC